MARRFRSVFLAVLFGLLMIAGLSSAVNARYVRLYCTSSNQYTYRVLELEVR